MSSWEKSLFAKQAGPGSRSAEVCGGLQPRRCVALADLAAAERLSGNQHDAAQDFAEAVKKMPVLPYALAEQWLDERAPGTDQASASKPSWTSIINADPQNYLAVASWYHSIGAWQSSDAVLHLAEANPSAAEIAPMINYYLASSARQLGHDQQADEYAKKAAASTVTGTFQIVWKMWPCCAKPCSTILRTRKPNTHSAIFCSQKINTMKPLRSGKKRSAKDLRMPCCCAI